MSNRRLQLRKTNEALELLNLIDTACNERDVLEGQRRADTERIAKDVWGKMQRTVCFENGKILDIETGKTHLEAAE